MKSAFRRILVALDLSNMDPQLLRYVAAMHSTWGAEKIYFVNIMPDFTVPKNVDAEFHKLFSSEYPIDEKIRDKLALDVQEHFSEAAGVELSVEVIEGKPYDKLLHWLAVKEIDLLVAGSKKTSEGSGIIPRRVARRARCSVIFVTQGSVVPKRLLVPVDFSDNAARALLYAVELAKVLPDATVQALHIVEAPSEKYYTRIAPPSGFRAMLAEASRRSYDKMIKTYQLEQSDIEPVFLQDDYVSIATRIGDFVEENGADLIIMGAQGRSAFEQFLYGSVTERLVEQNKFTPVLIIR